MRLFISYADPQRALARRLEASLVQEGHQVFMDVSSLSPGEAFGEEIREALADSDMMIFLVDSAALEPGRYTLSELAIAQAVWPKPEGRVLAVLLEGTKPADLPAYLSTLSALIPMGDPVAEIAAAIAQRPGLSVRLKRVFRSRWFGPLATVAAGLAVLAAVLTIQMQSHQEAAAALERIRAEQASNATVVSELAANTQTFGNVIEAVSGAVRHQNLQILAGLFPIENIDPNVGFEKLADVYNQRFDWLQASGLLDDETEVEKHRQACAAITRTIDKTAGVIVSLADDDQRRYVIRDQEWQLARDAIAQPDLAAIVPQLLTDMRDVRVKYANLVRLSAGYLDAIKDFCGDPLPTLAGLSAALAAERFAVRLIVEYAASIANLVGRAEEFDASAQSLLVPD